MKRWWLLILVVVALVVVIGGVKGFGVYRSVQAFAAQEPPKFTVSAVKASYQDWLPTLTAVGSLRADRGTELSSEVAGIVDAIHFKSGDDVKAGQLLLQLRSADDAAHLESLQANAVLAQTNYNRDLAQLAVQAISQSAMDTAAANLRSAKAQVAEQQALLNKKFVRAPFAGHLGVRAVDVGQYLSPGSKIVTLQQLDLIYVDFFVPQQELSRITVGQKVQASSDAYPGRLFAGEIAAIDPLVDANTRNVQVRAALKNPKHELLPGMSANVSIELGAPKRYLTLPQTAVSYNPYGATVFVVATESAAAGKGDGNPTAAVGQAPKSTKQSPPPKEPRGQLVAKQVFVTTGATRGDQVAILTGVKEGDEIVTSGQLKLKNGALITVNNEVQPSSDPHPAPQEQ
jgi:membrane fusion protein (multidrug efflux system)